MKLSEVIIILAMTYQGSLTSMAIPIRDKQEQFQEVVVKTALEMQKAIKMAPVDTRTMDSDGNAEIKGEEYTQGYNDAIQEMDKKISEFLHSYEKKK